MWLISYSEWLSHVKQSHLRLFFSLPSITSFPPALLNWHESKKSKDLPNRREKRILEHKQVQTKVHFEGFCQTVETLRSIWWMGSRGRRANLSSKERVNGRHLSKTETQKSCTRCLGVNRSKPPALRVEVSKPVCLFLALKEGPGTTVSENS